MRAAQGLPLGVMRAVADLKRAKEDHLAAAARAEAGAEASVLAHPGVLPPPLLSLPPLLPSALLLPVRWPLVVVVLAWGLARMVLAREALAAELLSAVEV